MTKNGFGGAINMMVGFTPDGEVINVNVLKQAETPGLGTKMADADNVRCAASRGRNSKRRSS
ncbi:MAG: FMN-binding protein [Alistipes sp.]